MLTAWVRPTNYHSNRGLSSVYYGACMLSYLKKLGIPKVREKANVYLVDELLVDVPSLSHDSKQGLPR